MVTNYSTVQFYSPQVPNTTTMRPITKGPPTNNERTTSTKRGRDLAPASLR